LIGFVFGYNDRALCRDFMDFLMLGDFATLQLVFLFFEKENFDSLKRKIGLAEKVGLMWAN
jgi:hypothetical protein